METLDWADDRRVFLQVPAGRGLVGHSQRKDTAADYFLAGRKFLSAGGSSGASLTFASNIGSEHVVGLAGWGAKDGVAMAHYELHAWRLLVLAWVFVPFYARSLVFTMPEVPGAAVFAPPRGTFCRHHLADHLRRLEDRGGNLRRAAWSSRRCCRT